MLLKKQRPKKRMEQMNLAEIFKRKVIERKSVFLREYGLNPDDDGVDSCFAFLYTAGAVSEEENELAELLFELSYQMAMQNLKSIGA